MKTILFFVAIILIFSFYVYDFVKKYFDMKREKRMRDIANTKAYEEFRKKSADEILADEVEKIFLSIFKDGKVVRKVKIENEDENFTVELILLCRQDVFLLQLLIHSGEITISDYSKKPWFEVDNWLLKRTPWRYENIPNFCTKSEHEIFEVENTLPDGLIQFDFRELFVIGNYTACNLNFSNFETVNLAKLETYFLKIFMEDEKYTQEEIDALYKHLVGLT